MFGLLSFSLALVSFLSIPFDLYFQMECLTCAIVCQQCLIPFDFYKGSQLRVCLPPQRRLWPWTSQQCWYHFGNTWRWTKCILLKDILMSLLGLEQCYGLDRKCLSKISCIHRWDLQKVIGSWGCCTIIHWGAQQLNVH